METPRLAFFDVDHTITRRATALRFAGLALKRGLISLSDLSSVPMHWIRYRLGLRGSGKADLSLVELPALTGIARSTLEDLARECFERKIGGDLFPPALEILQTLRAAGCRLALATSSLDLIVQPLAEYLAIEDVLASSLEFEDGLSTGRLRGKALLGEAKRDAALGLAERLGVALEEIAFYSDSVHDLPLLRVVGMPRIVNPDPKLRRLSRAEGWEILDFRRG